MVWGSLMKYHVSSQEKKNDVIRQLLNLPINGAYTVEVKKTASKRTLKQNNALHLWFEYIADSFNNVGQTMNINGMEIAPWWTKDLIKELSFKPVMKQLVGKDHTSDCEVDELCECIDIMAEAYRSIGHDVAVPSRAQLEGKA